MKRLAQPLSYELGPVRLYQDDVEELSARLRAVTESVEIQAGEFLVEPTDKLSDLGVPVFRELTIRTTKPAVLVILGARGAVITANDDDPSTRGVFEIVKDSLVTRERRFAGLRGHEMASGIILAMGLSAFLWTSVLLAVRITIAFAGLTLGILMALPMLRGVRGTYSTIIAKPRSEGISFWRRKADDIVLALISAIIGALITLAITKLSE